MRIKVKLSLKEDIQVMLIVDRQEPVLKVRHMAAAELGSLIGSDIPAERLSLFYLGKQLADGMVLFDYEIKHGGMVLAMLKQEKSKQKEVTSDVESANTATTTTLTMDVDKNTDMVEGADVLATLPEFKCDHCDNGPNSKCNHCGCQICGGKDDEANTLACDECGSYFHMSCLPVPLTEVPKDDWYCLSCQNDPNEIVVGEKKLDLSKSRKAKMPSATQTKKWGGGKACAGKSRSCTVVGPEYIGAIPGVRVGQSWRFRIHASEAGVHRPPVGGIAGSSKSPARSIVLSGGYPDDDDHGDEFYYTGSGGRDLSGNKREAKQQTADQELTRQNRSLALACAAPIDEINGGEAKDWKQSTPIRVLRTYKLAKLHPLYAPAEGVRYDGLYRIVKYWRQKGVSGHYVWRYLFRRDDPEPAPWTPEGREHIERLGIVMYESDTEEHDGGNKKGKKRAGSDNEDSLALKRVQNRIYVPSVELRQMMALDKENSRLWDKMAEGTYKTESAYLDALCEGELSCPICKELVQQPCTMPCGHNICNGCLCASLKNLGSNCPICRCDISSMGSIDDVRNQMNLNLVTVLRALIPSYGDDWKITPKVTKKQRAVRMGEPI